MLLSRKKLEIMANLRKISSDLAENLKNQSISRNIILLDTREIRIYKNGICKYTNP